MTNDFKFDVFGELMHYGNRQDRQIGDAETDEDWYSWEAEECDYKPDDGFGIFDSAIITVYGEDIRDHKYLVAWREIYE